MCNLCVKFIRDFNSLSYLRNRCCEIELSTCLCRDVQSHFRIVNVLDGFLHSAYITLVYSEYDVLSSYYCHIDKSYKNVISSLVYFDENAIINFLN